MVSVNLSGAFYMPRPVLEHMVERGSGRIVNKIPPARVGKPEEVSRVVLPVADASSCVTGQVWAVNGGMEM